MQDPNAPESGSGPWGAADYVASVSESGRLAVKVITGDQGLTVRLDGELDLETAEELERHLAAIQDSVVTRLLIDLGGVAFMDSTGLGAIVRAQQVTEANGCAFVVRRGSKQVQRLVALTGVDERLTFEGD